MIWGETPAKGFPEVGSSSSSSSSRYDGEGSGGAEGGAWGAMGLEPAQTVAEFAGERGR